MSKPSALWDISDPPPGAPSDDGLPTGPTLAGMAIALAIFYRGAELPLAPLPQLLALAVFAELAALRPALGIVFVPLTAPLYLIPAVIPGLRAEPLRLPLHEVALLAVAAAAAARELLRRRSALRQAAAGLPARLRGELGPFARRYAPHLLLLLSGIAGVLIAVPEGRGAALRELRWLIVEPLIFYALLRVYGAGDEARPSRSAAGGAARHLEPAVLGLILGGVIVAALGLLQLLGLDLVPLLGEKQNFGTPNVVEADGLRRVTSVFGHPNNLGLFLGRAWPVAAALALWWLGAKGGEPGAQGREARTSGAGTSAQRDGWLLALAALVCLAGLAVSFSRGAWLGAVAAGGVLGVGMLWRGAGERGGERRPTNPRLLMLALAAAVLAIIVVGLALSLRGGVGGGSVDARVLLWREALQLIQMHPLGLGLDQFYYYHNPEFGRSIMDPALAGTSEQYASHPHNLVLDAWLNVGPLGLLALGWLVARGYRAGVEALRRGPNPAVLGALAAMTAGLVHGLVDVFYFVEDLAIIFWMLLALVERAREHTPPPRPSGASTPSRSRG